MESMNAEDIINELKERHPSWNDPEHVASLRVRGLFALITQAYEEGFKHGQANQKTMDNLRNIGRKAGIDSDTFTKMFGGRT